MFELKFEAARGTLFTAEKQAAGSDSHYVNALAWLFQEAQKRGLSDTDMIRDILSFSVFMSHREAAMFYMHWQSTEIQCFYISRLKSYSTFERDEIRACDNAVMNIVENVFGARQRWLYPCDHPRWAQQSFSMKVDHYERLRFKI